MNKEILTNTEKSSCPFWTQAAPEVVEKRCSGQQIYEDVPQWVRDTFPKNLILDIGKEFTKTLLDNPFVYMVECIRDQENKIGTIQIVCDSRNCDQSKNCKEENVPLLKYDTPLPEALAA